MIVAHNMMAINAQRQFNIVGNVRKKSMEKLSSGYGVNRAADDAAGLAISEKMRRQIRGLNQGINNTQDGISMLQVADGALAEVHDMLHRITELSVKAANGTNTNDDRQAIQKEVNQILEEIERISDTTEFNGRKLFSPQESEEVQGQELAPVKVARDDIYGRLLNKNFPNITNDIRLQDGQVLDKQSAQELLLYMNSFAAVNEVYTTPRLSNGGDKDAVLKSFKMIADNAMAMKTYSVDGATYESKINAGMNLVNNTILYGRLDGPGDDSSNFSYAQTNFSEAANLNYSASPSVHEKARYQAATLACIASAERQSQNFSGNIASGQQRICSGIEAVLREAGITSGTVTTFARRNNGTPDSMDMIINMYDYVFNNSVYDIPENDPDDTEDEEKGIWIQSGVENGHGMYISIDEMNNSILGITGLNVSSTAGAGDALERTKGALEKISSNRSKIGAQQNRLEHTVANEANVVENTQAAESRIRDTDMAREMVELSKQNILDQVGISVMTQANQSNQGVLGLLQ